MSASLLMAVKVLLIIGLGIAFVWWQLRDLAREKERTAAQKKSLEAAGSAESNDQK